MADDELTARERRAQRVRAQQRKELPKKTLKQVAIAAAILLAVSGLAWGAWKLTSIAGCELEDKHEHATFHVYDRGERLRFQHPKFDLGSAGRPGVLPLKAHLHQPDDEQVHVEFGCTTVAQFFGYMGMDLRQNRFVLDQELHGGRVLETKDNLTLRFFLFIPDPMNPVSNGTWVEKPDLPGHQLRDFQRALITYGDLTPEEIEAQQAQVPAPTDSRPPRGAR